MAKETLYPHKTQRKLPVAATPDNIYVYGPHERFAGGLAFFLAPDKETADIMAKAHFYAGASYYFTLRGLIEEIAKDGKADYTYIE